MSEVDEKKGGIKEKTSKVMKRYNYLFGEMEAIYHEMSLKVGLSDSAMRILYAVRDNGERCPLRNICRYSGLSKQTINSALRKMEAEGILYLEPAGLKNKNVCLTEAGKLLTARTAGRIYEIENDIMESWPKEDVQTYLELTERFLRALQDRAKNI